MLKSLLTAPAALVGHAHFWSQGHWAGKGAMYDLLLRAPPSEKSQLSQQFPRMQWAVGVQELWLTGECSQVTLVELASFPCPQTSLISVISLTVPQVLGCQNLCSSREFTNLQRWRP